MPRPLRHAPAGMLFHVTNRAADHRKLFGCDEDYAHFEHLLSRHLSMGGIRLFAYCLMPNHWHLVLGPQQDERLASFMQALTGHHARTLRAREGTRGRGSLYQARYGAFPVQDDAHFLTVCRYVERNALTARLVTCAEDWSWSSLWRRERAPAPTPWLSNEWPVQRSDRWVARVNAPATEKEWTAWERSLRRGIPLGDSDWVECAAAKCRISLRPRGRPPAPEKVSDTFSGPTGFELVLP